MGGSGNIAGAILGGALISYIPDRLRGISDPLTTPTCSSAGSCCSAS